MANEQSDLSTIDELDNEVNSKVAFFEDKIEESKTRLDKLEKQILEFISQKKKQQAKTKIEEAKQVNLSKIWKKRN